MRGSLGDKGVLELKKVTTFSRVKGGESVPRSGRKCFSTREVGGGYPLRVGLNDVIGWESRYEKAIGCCLGKVVAQFPVGGRVLSVHASNDEANEFRKFSQPPRRFQDKSRRKQCCGRGATSQSVYIFLY